MSFFADNKDVTIHGGTFIAQRLESTVRGFDLLASKALPSAFHKADADPFHSTCHPNTRVRILDRIKGWANRHLNSEPFILWLHGAAGGGKTAIGRTIAQWCEREGILLGEFFFSHADGERDHIASLAATLAYRMATLTIPATKQAITRAVTHDPHVFSASLADQMRKLVLEPLDLVAPSTIIPHVIILDGLDECLSDLEQDLVLNVISKILHDLNPYLRILVLSRPEPAISTAFNASPLQDISTRISLSDDIDSDADIRTFLVEQFAKLKQQLPRPPSGEWPTGAEISQLVEKSSGQFIFAATVVKYVCSPRHRHNAVTRLKYTLDLKQLPLNAKQHPFAELDALYSLILSTRELEEVGTTVKATAVCLEYPKYFNAITPEDFAKVLRIELTRISAMLDELASLFEVNVNVIGPFHASFGDYLFDRSRSGDFYCDRGNIVAAITCAQLRQGRDPDVLSFHTFVRLLEDVSPNENLQNILNCMDPSSIFSGDPFNRRHDITDAYYLISLLRQLQKYISPKVNKKLVSYFDREFASHITGLYYDDDDDMPQLQSVSESSDGDDSDSDSSAVLPQVNSKRLLNGQAGEGETSDADGSQPGRSGKSFSQQAGKGNTTNKDDHNSEGGVDSLPPLNGSSIRKLVLLSASPAWDKLVISAGFNIPPSDLGSFGGICDDAPFVRSHLPKTLAVLLDGSKQVDAANYCFNQIMACSTKKNLHVVFSKLLPHSLFHATKSPKLLRRIDKLLESRHNLYKSLPSETQSAITNYRSKCQPHTAISSRPSSTSQTQRPSSTTQTQQPANVSQSLSTTSRTQRPSSVSQNPSTTSQDPLATSQPLHTAPPHGPPSASHHLPKSQRRKRRRK